MSRERIATLVNGYKMARVLLSAVELRLFDGIGEAGSTATEVALFAGSEPRATERLLNVLVSDGLLGKRDGRFVHTEESHRYLHSSSPEYMANLDHSVHLWDAWSTLTEAVQKGGPQEARYKAREKPERRESFIAAMHHFGLAQAGEVLARLDLSGVESVLDIGGGSGAYAIAFMETIGLKGRATVFDLHSVLPLTESYVAEAGLSDRIDTVAGDYLTDEFPVRFDLAFLSAIVHINSFEQNVELVARAARALNSGGQVVIRDFIANDDRSGPMPATMFAINMLVNTECGDTFTEAEIREWYAHADLTDVQRIDMGIGAGLFVGRKAG